MQFEEIPINKNNIKDLKIEVTCKNTLEAPLQENDIIGEIKVTEKEEEITTVNILLKETIEKKNIINYLEQLIRNYSTYMEQAM